MLPFLKPKQIATVIMANHSADGKLKDEPEEQPELMKHAESLISAIHAKDAKAAAEALEGINSHFEAGEADAADEEQE